MVNKVSMGYNFQKKFHITNELIVLFAKVSSDFNPIHLDAGFAEKTLFKRPIAHGFLTASFISSVLGNDFPGTGTIYLSQNLEFKAPVYAGDTIAVDIKLIDYLGKNKYKLETKCTNHSGILVISGYAIVYNSVLEIC